jgi:hypothetical protein
MSDRPPFDPLRAAFLLLFFVIAIYAVTILGMVGACIYHAEIIIRSDKDISCDPYNRLMSLMAAALAAALAFAGIRTGDRNNKDDNDKEDKP